MCFGEATKHLFDSVVFVDDCCACGDDCCHFSTCIESSLVHVDSKLIFLYCWFVATTIIYSCCAFDWVVASICVHMGNVFLAGSFPIARFNLLISFFQSASSANDMNSKSNHRK